jgi:hypothetical protein
MGERITEDTSSAEASLLTEDFESFALDAVRGDGFAYATRNRCHAVALSEHGNRRFLALRTWHDAAGSKPR